MTKNSKLFLTPHGLPLLTPRFYPFPVTLRHCILLVIPWLYQTESLFFVQTVLPSSLFWKPEFIPMQLNVDTISAYCDLCICLCITLYARNIRWIQKTAPSWTELCGDEQNTRAHTSNIHQLPQFTVSIINCPDPHHVPTFNHFRWAFFHYFTVIHNLQIFQHSHTQGLFQYTEPGLIFLVTMLHVKTIILFLSGSFFCCHRWSFKWQHASATHKKWVWLQERN